MNYRKESSGIATICRRFLCLALAAMVSFAAAAQGKSVSGKVLDQDGEAVIGATVMVKGTTNGTATDFDGAYKLSNVAENATLVFSYVGCVSQEVKVAGKSVIDVTLLEDSNVLDDLVVVGYGVQKKSDVTGAMTRVDSEVLNDRPVSNAFEALQGKAAGVNIGTSERPGTVPDVRIRGNRSLSGGNSPLYVVDGVPLMSDAGIETINPRDIESIDILKDASATAIYGSRGANGVILITTKQGKSGQFSLNYSGSVTWSNIVDKSPSMTAAEFIDFRRWAAINSGDEKLSGVTNPSQFTKELDSYIFDSPLDGNTTRDNVLRGWANGTWNPDLVEDYDWTDFVTQTGFSHEHTVSASGGSENLNGYASFGYMKNDGTQKGQWYERYTGKVSVNINPVKWMAISASMNGTYARRDYGISRTGARSQSGPDAIYGLAKSIYNISPAYDEDGNIIINPGGESSVYTIMDDWNRTTQKSERFRFLSNFSATLKVGEIFKVLEGLQYKISFGPDFEYWREGVALQGDCSYRINSTGEPGTNYAKRSDRRNFSWTLDNMITYNRTFADKHNVGVTLLQTASKWNTETSSMSAEGFAQTMYLWNAMGSVDITNSDNKAEMSTGLTDRQLESYMIRVNYGFNDRYLLTASGRWDGASQLAEGYKWDFFPSMAVAWRIDQEEFMNFNWLNNLKLRLGVGTTGNAGVSPYQTKGSISSFYLPFNGLDNVLSYATNEPYYTKDQVAMANPDLGWEKTTQWNVGLDFGFLNNRINGSLEFYTSQTKDILMSMNIPTLTGFPNTWANVGRTSNKGVEITLNATPLILPCGFVWETNINAAWQKDKIVELAYGKNDMVDNAWFIGQSMDVFYGYESDGIWQIGEEAEMAKWNENGYNFTPGNVKPKDQNNDYKMDDDDRVVIGNTNPRWTFGWSNTFSWKGIELGLSMIGRFGYKFNTGGYAMTAHANQNEVDYWTPDNPNAEYQKPILAQATSGSGDAFASLLGYKDGGFLRMRNISLGYNFSKKLLSHTDLKNVKIYGQVINPFDFYQAVKGWDCDTGNTYFNRSWVIGLEVGF